MDSGINLFDSDASEPLIPSLKEIDGVSSDEVKRQLSIESNLISSGIDKAISGDTVKSMLLAEESGVMQPNYVVDFTDVSEVHNFQLEGLDALLNPDGDTWVYVYTKNGGLNKLGRGKSEVLDRILTIAVANLFDSKCKIYKDFQIGKQLNIVSEKDITTMKLSL